MSVIIRLQNLPWSANAADIRRFFEGLSIPDGGVHIVGGEQGDAFIAFSTDEDARMAMQKNMGILNNVQVVLFLSSKTEMQNVIAAARNASSTIGTSTSESQVPDKIPTQSPIQTSSAPVSWQKDALPSRSLPVPGMPLGNWSASLDAIASQSPDLLSKAAEGLRSLNQMPLNLPNLTEKLPPALPRIPGHNDNFDLRGGMQPALNRTSLQRDDVFDQGVGVPVQSVDRAESMDHPRMRNAMHGVGPYQQRPPGTKEPSTIEQAPFGKSRIEQVPFGKDRMEQTPFGKDRIEQAPFGKDRIEQAPFGRDYDHKANDKPLRMDRPLLGAPKAEIYEQFGMEDNRFDTPKSRPLLQTPPSLAGGPRHPESGSFPRPRLPLDAHAARGDHDVRGPPGASAVGPGAPSLRFRPPKPEPLSDFSRPPPGFPDMRPDIGSHPGPRFERGRGGRAAPKRFPGPSLLGSPPDIRPERPGRIRPPLLKEDISEQQSTWGAPEIPEPTSLIENRNYNQLGNKFDSDARDFMHNYDRDRSPILRGDRNERNEPNKFRNERRPLLNYNDPMSGPNSGFHEQNQQNQDFEPQNQSSQERFGHNHNSQERFGQNRNSQERFGQNRNSQERFGQNRNSQERFGQNRNSQERFGQNQSFEEQFGPNQGSQDRFGQNRNAQERFGQNKNSQERFGERLYAENERERSKEKDYNRYDSDRRSDRYKSAKDDRIRSRIDRDEYDRRDREREERPERSRNQTSRNDRKESLYRKEDEDKREPPKREESSRRDNGSERDSGRRTTNRHSEATRKDSKSTDGETRKELSRPDNKKTDIGKVEAKVETSRKRRRDVDSSTSIHVTGLPVTVSFRDMRRFFLGCEIPWKGLKLINDKYGNRTGVAFVKFDNEEFAREAVKRSGRLVDNNPVTITRCSDDDFEDAVDSFIPNRDRDRRGSPTPESPKRLKVEETQQMKDQKENKEDKSEKPVDKKDTPINYTVRNLPVDVEVNDLHEFFKPLKVKSVFFNYNRDGSVMDSGYIEFEFGVESVRVLRFSGRELKGKKIIVEQMKEEPKKPTDHISKTDTNAKEVKPQPTKKETSRPVSSQEPVESKTQSVQREPRPRDDTSRPRDDTSRPRVDTSRPRVDTSRSRDDTPRPRDIRTRDEMSRPRDDIRPRERPQSYEPTDNDLRVKLYGIPYDATIDDILYFCKGLELVPGGTLLFFDDEGRARDTVYIQLRHPKHVEYAVRRTGRNIRHRYINVSSISNREIVREVRRFDSTFSLDSLEPRAPPQGPVTSIFDLDVSDANRPINTNTNRSGNTAQPYRSDAPGLLGDPPVDILPLPRSLHRTEPPFSGHGNKEPRGPQFARNIEGWDEPDPHEDWNMPQEMPTTRNLPGDRLPPEHLQHDDHHTGDWEHDADQTFHKKKPSLLGDGPSLLGDGPADLSPSRSTRSHSEFLPKKAQHSAEDDWYPVALKGAPPKVTLEDILEFFLPFRPVADSVKVRYKADGTPTGDVVVAFMSAADAGGAIRERNMKPLLGKPVPVFKP